MNNMNNNFFYQFLMNNLKNTPQYQQVMSMINNGANPKDLFYKLCKDRGIDPNTILSQIQPK